MFSFFFREIIIAYGCDLRKQCLHGTFITQVQARRSQDLEKGGGYFERVRSVQTTLTRIFIDLESVSDDLSEI